MNAITPRHPKYRTKLCRNFAGGTCTFGDKCSFLHSVPRVVPPSLLTEQIVDWSVLLPQLLSQQATLNQMPRGSPPSFQEPHVIDEGPSPSPSLLLSLSDSGSSEQLPQTGYRQKKYPCRHFLRTGGWCPVGSNCKFFHDLDALPSAEVQKAEHSSPSETDSYGAQGRTISGGVMMGMQAPFPPTILQRSPVPARFTDAELAQTHLSPPLVCSGPTDLNDLSDRLRHWSCYAWQAYRPYCATLPEMTAMPVPVTASLSPFVQNDGHSLSQTQAGIVPPSETQNSLPPGAYQVNGTTYFPSIPSVPAPPPATYSLPAHPTPYNHVMPPTYAYYAPPALPASYCDISNQVAYVRSLTSFDPFGSDRLMPSELPVIPRITDNPTLPVQRDALPIPSSSPGGMDASLTPTSVKPPTTCDDEFPYRPPKEQRAGHARRISVNIKKHDRSNSG